MEKKRPEDLSEADIQRLETEFKESMKETIAKAEDAKANGDERSRQDAAMDLIEGMVAFFEKHGLAAAAPAPKAAPAPVKDIFNIDQLDEATLREGPVEVLVGRYAVIASAAKEASRSGRITRYNRLSDRVRTIAKALQARTPDGRRALLPLLSHPDSGVREFAAYDCRDFSGEAKAERPE